MCRRRRRRNSRSAKHRALSPNDSEEYEAWRHEKPYVRSSKGFTSRTQPIDAAGAPLTSERDTSHLQSNHANPFVPVPPPPRRSASRSGLHDVTAYSAHPYSPEHVTGLETNNNAHHSKPGSNDHALAAGLGGAALGGLAAHAIDRHDRKQSEPLAGNVFEKTKPTYSEEELNTLPEAATEERRSGSVGRASVKEPWPYTDAVKRRSMDSAKSGNRSSSRSQDHFSTPDSTPADSHGASGVGLAGAAAAGGLAGAITSRKKTSRSPHKRGILKQTLSDSSDPASTPSDRGRSKEPMLVAHPEKRNSTASIQSNTSVHELETVDIPPTPPARDRRQSILGSAAPLAATGAMATVAGANHGRRRSTSHGSKSDVTLPPPVLPEPSVAPPRIPSRSPKRASLDSRARYSISNSGALEPPEPTPKLQVVSPQFEPQGKGDQDALLSPVSPIADSRVGSWSNVQAKELGMSPEGATKPLSQESTVIGSASPSTDLSASSSENQSSGLVSAISKIFSSGRGNYTDEESQSVMGHPPNSWDNNEQRFRKVPRRKPAPAVVIPPVSQQNNSQRASVEGMPGSWTQGSSTPSQQNTARSSSDSARSFSFPNRTRGRGTSINKISTNDFATGTGNLASQHTGSISNPTPTHPRPLSLPASAVNPYSRSGYGIGSGDPFDLARTRTDSSMTGVSLASANYQDPAPRPRPFRSSTGSDYPQPTLADLRREVMAEDRERARQTWRRSQSRERSESLGQRYGDDRDLWNIIDQTTGQGRFYANHDKRGYESTRRRSRESSVGRAY